MNRLVAATLLLLLSIVSLLPTDGRIILTEDETIESDQLNQARPPTVDEVRASLPYNVSTVLADYIAREEEVYSFVELPQFQEQGIGFTSYVLNVTSLRWLDETKVSRSIWWHFVVIFVPTTPEPRFVSNAFLYITGNTNLDSRPPSITSLGDWFPQIELVTEGKQVVVTIFQIPNAPIQFFEEKPVPLNRTEDAMIAWTWKHFLSDPSDPTWLARLPMVKSCIQAMNAATEYMANRATGPFQQLQRWVVAGASKRGWTTWLVGAMDTRVIAIAPLVFDELNFVANIHHHYRAYGGWSFALKDYVALNLTGAFDDPLLAVMMEIVDPYSYFKTSRLAEIPKFVVSASGDEFLLTDNIRYFWDEMPGPKHFISWPNLEHSMGGNPFEVINSVLSYTVQVQLNQTLPDYSWYINNSDGSIYLIVDQPWPDSVEFWYAQTIDGSARRDFRLATCPDGCPNPRKYTMHNVTWVNDNQYLDINTKSYGLMKIGAWMNVPPSGWVAFSVTLGWKDQNGGIFNVSTAPSILPMAFPYPDCQGTGCIAGMV